jgi:hypothetical protein
MLTGCALKPLSKARPTRRRGEIAMASKPTLSLLPDVPSLKKLSQSLAVLGG